MHLPLGKHRLEYRIAAPAAAGASQHPMLVLLHEGLGSLAMWKDFPDVLAQRTGHRVLAYSRYGHGRSSELTAPRPVDYMHVEANEVLPQLLAELDITEPWLIGHSDGASIAIIHAGSGQPVRGLVLMAPHVFVEDRTIDAIAAARRSFDTTDLAARLARYHEHPHTMFRGWNDIWLDPRFRNWNIEAFVKAIRSPLLLMQCRNDPYGTVAQLEAIEHLAAGPVEKRLFAGVSHALHVDHRDETIEAIARFVDLHGT